MVPAALASGVGRLPGCHQGRSSRSTSKIVSGGKFGWSGTSVKRLRRCPRQAQRLPQWQVLKQNGWTV